MPGLTERGDGRPPLVATWSNWWGSPQLLATTARRMAEVVGGEPATATITLDGRDWTERFAAPEDFVGVGAEARSGFSTLSVDATGQAGSARLVLVRDPWWARVRGREEARLEIHSEHAGGIAAELIPQVSRGYRPYWGRCEFPPGTRPRTAWQRHGHLTRLLVNLLVALVLVALVLIADTELPEHQLPLPVVAALGLLVPLLIDTAVPSVEVAPEGRTRLMAIRKWVLLAIASAVAARVIAGVAGIG